MKRYEPSNNPGNVMTVISDKITPIDTTSDGLWDYFNPSLVSATDYYPFGMGMPGRVDNNIAYRFQFNGKEQDFIAFKEGYSVDYGFRIYNSLLGRFLSVDPLCKHFAWWTPYQFAGNTPIQAVDLDGLEILLPRIVPIPVEPVITFPRAPTIPLPIPPGEVILPPVLPSLPNDVTAGQPKNSTIDKTEEFDWSKVDRGKPETWPEPPFSGDRKVGDPARQKAKDRGEKSWYDDEGGEWRPHIPDEHHPEGHWDYKPPGEHSPWQNVYKRTLPEVIISPETKPKNIFENIWDGIKDIFTPTPSNSEEIVTHS